MLDWLMDPINNIIDWLHDDIYQFFVDAFAYLVEQATLGIIKFTIWSSVFAWDVAKQIIIDLNVTANLNAAWNTIPADIAGILQFFAVPDLISIVITAFITRYVLKFIPFTGK